MSQTRKEQERIWNRRQLMKSMFSWDWMEAKSSTPLSRQKQIANRHESLYANGMGGSMACSVPPAYYADIWRRGIVNREPVGWIAKKTGVCHESVTIMLREFSKIKHCPTPERMAAAAMLIPDRTDKEIAEAFQKPIEWAERVRQYRDRIAGAVGLRDVAMEEGWRVGDPTPAEILTRAAALREARPPEHKHWVVPETRYSRAGSA